MHSFFDEFVRTREKGGLFGRVVGYDVRRRDGWIINTREQGVEVGDHDCLSVCLFGIMINLLSGDCLILSTLLFIYDYHFHFHSSIPL